MKRLSFLVILAGIVFCWQASHAQLNKQDQDKARDLLRKKLAEDQPAPASKAAPVKPQPAKETAKPEPTKPAPTKEPAAKEPAAVPPKSTPANEPAAPKLRLHSVVERTPEISPSHQQMLDILHRALAQEQATPAEPKEATKAAESKPAKIETKAEQKAKTPPKAEVETTPKAPEPETKPTVAQPPAGPKTKAEKLKDLNELYFADKISPEEYHKRRAEIVAEK